MRHHQTPAHHTGSEVVAFLDGGVYAYRALDRDSRHGGKAAALSLKSIPRPDLTQLGLDFLALSKSGRRHFLTLDAGMGFPHLYTQHPHGSRDQTVGLCHLGWPCRGFSTPTRHDLLFELFAEPLMRT